MLVSFQCRIEYPSGFVFDSQFEATGLITAICGPSGSGKTTLISLIAGSLRPDQGQIVVGETTFCDTSQQIELAVELRQVGLHFQDNCLFPHLTVQNNITYPLRRQRDRRIPFTFDTVVSMLELEPLLGRRVQSLSGGQQQRVALARALVSAGRILLLDEPLTAIEESLRERVGAQLKSLIEAAQVPTILVSHHQAVVQQLATDVLFIEQGVIQSPSSGHVVS